MTHKVLVWVLLVVISLIIY